MMIFSLLRYYSDLSFFILVNLLVSDKAPNPFIIGESHRSISEHFVQHDKDENADIIKELPLETIIKRSLTAPIMAQ